MNKTLKFVICISLALVCAGCLDDEEVVVGVNTSNVSVNSNSTCETVSIDDDASEIKAADNAINTTSNQSIEEAYENEIRVKDVSRREVISFINSDGTDEETYSDCEGYAKQVQLNARSKGIRCGLAYVDMQNGYSYVLNCFDTTDYGMIYTSSEQWDVLATCEVGGTLTFKGLIKGNTNWRNMGDIKTVDIVW